MLVIHGTSQPKCSNRAQQITRGCFCFCFLLFLLGFLWVLNIPKWRSNDSGPIAILFRWILELPKFTKHRPSLDHKKYKKFWEHQAWVYGLRWRPVSCIFFLSDFLGFRLLNQARDCIFVSDFLGFRHVTAFYFMFFFEIVSFFRFCVSLRSLAWGWTDDSLVLWLSFMLSIIQAGDGEVWRLCGCTWAPNTRWILQYSSRKPLTNACEVS